MKYTRHIRFYLVLLCLLSSPTFSWSTSWYKGENWHAIFTKGFGLAITNDAGVAQSFNITPTSNQFYRYEPNDHTQTSLLVDGFLGVEWMLHAWLIQVGVDYNQASLFKSSGTLVQGNSLDDREYAYSYSILTRQLLVETKLLWTIRNRLHPFVRAGVGVSFNQAFGFETTVPPELAITREYGGSNTASFSYSAGVGFDFDITPSLRGGINYRFTDLGKVCLGNATLNKKSLNRSLEQNHFYVNQLLAQLTMLF